MPALGHRPPGAVVHHQPSAHRACRGAATACTPRAGPRRPGSACPDRGPRRPRRWRPRRKAGGDHGLDAARARDPGRAQLGGDAARAPARPGRRRFRHGLGLRGVQDLGDQARVGRRWIAVIHAVDVGQQHQKPRLQHKRDVRGQGIVVAEGDLVGRGRVVLVHDRHDAPRHQPAQGAARVHVRAAAVDVGLGQEHLADVQVVAGKRALPVHLQQRLAERGGGLQVAHRPRADGLAELAEARGRPRRS